jgi:hypothetical protein
MHSRIVHALVVGLAELSFATPLCAAEPPASRLSFDTVADVAVVTARDATGHAQRFTDKGNREFSVKYDAHQRVQSVEATRGPHFSDIVVLTYGEDGKVRRVKFRSGYALFFDTEPRGARVIRDSRGGTFTRAGRATQPVDSVAAKQSAETVVAVAELESLMSALGQPLL